MQLAGIPGKGDRIEAQGTMRITRCRFARPEERSSHCSSERLQVSDREFAAADF